MQAQHPAMILAAGLGKRMRAYDASLPKPMVQVAGQPLIDYALALLAGAGIRDCVVNTHYLPETIEAHLAAQRRFAVTVSREEELLETGGGIRRALPLLQESFFVLNSDVICRDSQPSALQRMREFWNPEVMDGLLLLIPRERATGYEGAGDFALASDGRLHPRETDKPAYVFTGVQLLHRRFVEGVTENKFSLSPLYKAALAQNPCRLFGLVHAGEWYHVGDPQGVALAEQELAVTD